MRAKSELSGVTAGYAAPESRMVLAQHVSDAADGVDQARFAARFKLAADVSDIYLKRVGGGREVEPPHFLQHESAFQHPARPLSEELQERVFGAGEPHFPIAAIHFARHRVHVQIAELQR